MVFVNRHEEILRIQKELKEGHNVIISGKYGIGRTALINRVAEMSRDRWRFIHGDFSQARRVVCENIFIQLFPKLERLLETQHLSYKSIRHRLTHLVPVEKKPLVLVLDNIARLTPQKMELIRDLILAERFRLVVIAELFLRGEELFKLRAWLEPSHVIKLELLSQADTYRYFSQASLTHGLNWSEGDIETLTLEAGGYPYGMNEILSRHLNRRRKAWIQKA